MGWAAFFECWNVLESGVVVAHTVPRPGLQQLPVQPPQFQCCVQCCVRSCGCTGRLDRPFCPHPRDKDPAGPGAAGLPAAQTLLWVLGSRVPVVQSKCDCPIIALCWSHEAQPVSSQLFPARSTDHSARVGRGDDRPLLCVFACVLAAPPFPLGKGVATWIEFLSSPRDVWPCLRSPRAPGVLKLRVDGCAGVTHH